MVRACRGRGAARRCGPPTMTYRSPRGGKAMKKSLIMLCLTLVSSASFAQPYDARLRNLQRVEDGLADYCRPREKQSPLCSHGYIRLTLAIEAMGYCPAQTAKDPRWRRCKRGDLRS